MILLILAVVTVEGTGVIMTISFGRSLTAVLLELNDAAIRVGKGDFSVKVQVRSEDKLAQLANSLNAILGFSELLSAPDVSPSDRARYAKIIKRTGDSLTSIINDILDISKVEAKQVEIESSNFSLSQLMADLATLLKMRADEKGIELLFIRKPGVPDWIQSDASRLRQILANIVGNSIKFTEAGSVKVDYGVEGPHLVFMVTDTGGGIAPDRVDRLFKPFSQGDDSVQKKFGGTGLGLMISQRLAQLLGADVGLAENRPTIGSTFFVKIRFNAAVAPTITPVTA